MASDSDEVIRQWSIEKLDLLAQYLQAYSQIMNRQKQTWLRSYSYIDAFASVGQYIDEDFKRYVDGSPFVALKCTPPFDDYWFIELSDERLRNLRQRIEAEYPTRGEVHYERGDANTVLRQTIIKKITKRDSQRGFIFLDPYGLEVDFSTIRELGRAKVFDLFINFSVMGITRQLPLVGLPDPSTKAQLDRVMGNTSWLNNLYQQQLSLIGEPSFRRRRLRPSQVANWYADELKQLFPHVSEPVLMRNSRGGPLYVLFLASHNETAVKITNDIFKRYERRRVP